VSWLRGWGGGLALSLLQGLSPQKLYSSSSAHEAVSCHVGGQPTVINHYVPGRVGIVEFQSRVAPLLHRWIGTVIHDFWEWTTPPYYVVISDREQ
jgi:hypothetical protein